MNDEMELAEAVRLVEAWAPETLAEFDEVRVLLAYCKNAVQQAAEALAESDRMERGMLPGLCELCDVEIPEDSDYTSDDDGCTFCESCSKAIAEDSPDPENDE